jgi:hypothetical protein
VSKPADTSVLTANRLGDGAVVFLDFEGAWSESLAEAVVARSPDEVRALQDRADYDAARNLIVEAYLVDVRETVSGLVPLRQRERVRAAGPSILDDVPGYVAPASPAAGLPGGSRVEEQWHTSALVAATHPEPLPIVKNDGERELRAEAA